MIFMIRVLTPVHVCFNRAKNLDA